MKKPPLTPTQQAYKTLYGTLTRERKMRERVFRFDTPQLTTKLQKIDDALKALDVLAQAIKQQQAAEQAALFGEVAA